MRVRAARKLEQRRGRGYFVKENKRLHGSWEADLAAMRARTAIRWQKLEQDAMANILRAERELDRAAA